MISRDRAYFQSSPCECSYGVTGLVPGPLPVEFSSVLSQLFLLLPIFTVLASRTLPAPTSKLLFSKLTRNWSGRLYEADSFKSHCHMNLCSSNKSPSQSPTERKGAVLRRDFLRLLFVENQGRGAEKRGRSQLTPSVLK